MELEHALIRTRTRIRTRVSAELCHQHKWPPIIVTDNDVGLGPFWENQNYFRVKILPPWSLNYRHGKWAFQVALQNFRVRVEIIFYEFSEGFNFKLSWNEEIAVSKYIFLLTFYYFCCNPDKPKMTDLIHPCTKNKLIRKCNISEIPR